jgi:DNA-directed RNA polymerase subunit alpha
VEIINKNAPVATLTDKKAKLEMEIFIKNGVGYEPVERRQKEKLEIGVIALDAIFSPIKKVSYKVENMRVGERTDFDRLTLEIETDGTITPMDALARASKILIKHFSQFFETFKEEEKLPKVAASVQKKKSRRTKKQSAPQKKKKSTKKRNAQT